MDYVNAPKPAPPPHSPQPEPPIDWRAVAHGLRLLPRRRMVAAGVLGIAALLATLVALLALSPIYAGLANGLDLQLARLFAPLSTYLFRNATINTAMLLMGVYTVALTLGWTWAVTGIPHYARPFLLLPLFIPGALIGLLWRPLFAGWLDLAQAPLSLTITALVLLWRAVPLAAWLFSWNRDAWPKFMALCALLILLDGDLILTLTRGEPFNASHTWASWIVQQLWSGRAWGYAASMAGALSVAVAALTVWGLRRTHDPIFIHHGSPLGHFTALVWLLGPLLIPLVALVQSPLTAFSALVELGALRWLLNGALLWGAATWLAMWLAWPLPTLRARLVTRTLTVTMLPITTVALAYLAAELPFLRGLWLLIILVSFFTTGLLLGDDPTDTPNREPRRRWLRAAGYAALVMAHTFPLQLVLQLPPRAWTPTLGAVWTLAEAPHATAALGALLLFAALWAGVGSWLLFHTKPIPTLFQTRFPALPHTRGTNGG